MLNTHPYANWFIIQVNANRESHIKNFIEKNVNESVQLVVFTQEIIHVIKQQTIKVTRVLFPGYIFVHGNVKHVFDRVKLKDNELIKPVCLKNEKCSSCFNELSPCMVKPAEMALLFNNSDTTGVFKMSYGYKIGELVIINEGPLKNLAGNILWFNEKKRKACVEIELLQRKMQITLGVDIIKKDR